MAKTAMTGRRGERSPSPPRSRSPPKDSVSFSSASGSKYSITGHNNVDQNSIQISVHKLNGKNYVPWSQAMKLMIRGKGKLGYLTGSVKSPEEDDPAYEKWDAENSTIMSWLINSMDIEIGQLFLFCPTAKEIWEMAKETYSDLGNLAQVFELKTRLWETKQNGMSVTQYYSILAQLWQELDMFMESDWSCTLDSVKYKKMLEKERIFEFLAGLNQELDEVRGRVLSKDPLPSIREVFAVVRREESRRKVMMGEFGSTGVSNMLPGSEGSALVSKGWKQST